MNEADRAELERIRAIAVQMISDTRTIAEMAITRYAAVADLVLAELQMLVGIVLENGDAQTCKDVRAYLKIMHDRFETLIPPQRIH